MVLDEVFLCQHICGSKHLSFFFLCEEDWPWANICCQSSSFCLRKIVAKLTSVPVFLCCVWDATTAWFDEQCQVRAQDLNLWTSGHQSRAWELNHYTTGPTPRITTFAKFLPLESMPLLYRKFWVYFKMGTLLSSLTVHGSSCFFCRQVDLNCCISLESSFSLNFGVVVNPENSFLVMSLYSLWAFLWLWGYHLLLTVIYWDKQDIDYLKEELSIC